MNRIVLAFAITFLAQFLPAQEVTYVVFNRDCMSQLMYRYAYPNVKGEDPIYAYSIQPNVLENYVFTSKGAGHYSPTMPNGAVSCRSLELNDGYVAALNREDKQMLIVFQRQEGGYWLMPIGSATLVARSGQKYWIRSKNCSFTFDTLRMENDRNLAITGSATAVYFKGAKLRNCLMEYSFHCESIKSGQIRSDVDLIPSLGFSSDQTGTSSATALENQMQLFRVNGQNIDDYIGKGCPEGGKIEVSKNQKPTQYGYDKESYGYSEVDKEVMSIKSNKALEVKPAAYNYAGETVSVDCPEKLGEGYHVVQRGDNLRAISRTYNVDVPTLVKWNNIANPNAIEVCQIIWYKKPPATTNKPVGEAAPKPVQHTTPENQVVDQRKLKQLNNEKSAPPPTAYYAEDDGYDSWRQKPQTASTKGAVKPNQYEYYDEAKPASERPLIHTVQKGEYLYKLARMYNCPEECIRQANNMPVQGDIAFNIGEKVIIPACDCLKAGRLSQKNQPYDEPVNTPAKQEKMSSGNLLNPVTYNYDDPYAKKVEGKTGEAKKLVDEWPINEPDKVAASINAKDTKTAGKSNNTDQPKVPLFKEHVAKQGDTLRSIATKYKVDPAELAQVNGLGLNEAIIPGKWILIPIQD